MAVVGVVDVAVALGVVDVACSSFGVVRGARGTMLVVRCTMDSGVIAGEVV